MHDETAGLYAEAYQQLLFLSENRDVFLKVIPVFDRWIELFWQEVLAGNAGQVDMFVTMFRALISAVAAHRHVRQDRGGC